MICFPTKYTTAYRRHTSLTEVVHVTLKYLNTHANFCGDLSVFRDNMNSYFYKRLKDLINSGNSIYVNNRIT